MQPGLRQLIVLLTLPMWACQLTPTFTTGYEVPAERLRASPVEGTLAVTAFTEARPPRLYTMGGKMFMTYIPFLPYVSFPFERLEESVRIQSDAIAEGGAGITMGATQNVAPPFEEYYYPTSFPRALADDLAASGLFRSVEYVGDGSTEGYRYVLGGTLHETPFRHTASSYGLGIVGVLLWFLPIPMLKATGGVNLDMELEDQETGQVVWQKHVESSLSRYMMLYTSSAMIYGRGGAFSLNVSPPPSESKVDRRSLFSWHFEALRRGVLGARAELADALESRH